MRIVVISMLLAMLFLSGCAMFQPRPAIPEIPVALTPQQQLTKMVSSTNWVVTLMLFGVGAAFFAFLNGNSKGLQAMAACFVVLSLALGIARFSVWISIVSMLGSLALMAYTVMVKNKALREVVTGVEDVRKTLATTSGWESIKKVVDGLLKDTQSVTTQAVVKGVKNAEGI